MSTAKKRSRLSKAVRPSLLKASDVEDISSTSPPTFNLIERRNMATAEANEAPPSRLEALNFHMPGDTGTAPALPALIQIAGVLLGCGRDVVDVPLGEFAVQPNEEVVTDDRGKAPMLITTETAGLTPPSPNDCCKWFPTESYLGAYKSDDPSKAPQGSLIHTLYKQLRLAGNEGMTLHELLASFKQKTAWKSFESDWEHKVWFHLQNNPHFHEVKEYGLRSHGQPGLQRLPKPTATVTCMGPMTAHVTAGELELALRRTLQSDIKDTAQPPTITSPWFSITHPKGLRTRRKACHKTAVHKQKLWWLARPLSTQPATLMPLPKSSMNPKSSSALHGNEQPSGLPVPICGGSRKHQAQSFSKPWETMTSVSCSRKDVPKKRNCPLNAQEVSKLVSKLSEHQFSKDANKRARYAVDEAQMIANLDSMGYTGLLASQMKSMRPPGVLAQQLPQSNRILSSRATSRVKSVVDDNLGQPSHGHSQGNVNHGNSHFPERMELRMVTTASNRQFLIAQTTPASGVAVTAESDGQSKAIPAVIRPRTMPPLSPPHGIPGKAQKTRSLQSL